MVEPANSRIPSLEHLLEREGNLLLRRAESRRARSSDQTLVSVISRGNTFRRRRRTLKNLLAALGVTALALAGTTGLFPTKTGRQVVTARQPSTATDTAGEPSSFVAELKDEVIAVIDSHTGAIVRQLTPVPHDFFGTLSPDRTTLYLDIPAGLEPNCPTGQCAIDVATGTTTPLPPFRWDNVSPSHTGAPISPDGTHRASITTTIDGTAQVILATVNSPPVTYGLDTGDQPYADPLWSPHGQYLALATGPDGNSIVIMNANNGSLIRVHAAPGCSVFPAALTDTRLLASEYCGIHHQGRIAPYQLATGRPNTPIPLPPGQNQIVALDATADGQYIIASLSPSSGHNAENVWTEHAGTWIELTNIQAADVAW